MSVRTIAILTTFCLSTLPAMSDESAKEINMNTAQSQTALRTRTRATAKIIVQNSEAKPYDQTVSPALVEMRLSETFTGDIDGESPVRALQVLRDDRSACLVSVQRFHGKIGGRQGHLRASRFRNRRERKDHCDMVCYSRVGDQWSFRAARRGRF